MKKPLPTEFDASIELLLSLGTIDGKRRALIKSGIKAHVFKLVKKCVGEPEQATESWMPFSTNEAVAIRNHHLYEILRRFEEALK